MINLKEILNLAKCLFILGVLGFSYLLLLNLVIDVIPKTTSSNYTKQISELETRLETETNTEEINFLNYKINEVQMKAYERKDKDYFDEIVAVMFIPTIVCISLLLLVASRIAESIGDLFFSYEEDGTGTSKRIY